MKIRMTHFLVLMAAFSLSVSALAVSLYHMATTPFVLNDGAQIMIVNGTPWWLLVLWVLALGAVWLAFGVYHLGKPYAD
jgi:hypothetical protein